MASERCARAEEATGLTKKTLFWLATCPSVKPNGWSSAAGRRQRRPATQTMIRLWRAQCRRRRRCERITLRRATGGLAAEAIG
jgi:hypothetical protein